MNLKQLLAGLPDIIEHSGDTDVEITLITSDSRQVTPGALFVAYQGVNSDGQRFIGDAVARGAAAVVGEAAEPGLPVPYVRVDDGRAALGWLSAAWYGNPSLAMTLVGITGTDGKTTTANLLYCMLKAAGRRTGLISTVNAIIGDESHDTGLHTTTPDAPEVQHYLAQMRDAGTEVAVLEVTSHGLAQHRVTGCLFDVAVITNITHEHLDFHGTFEAYREAKAMLFRSLSGCPPKPGMTKSGVVNRDDESYAFFSGLGAHQLISYGLHPPNELQRVQSQLTLTAGPISHTPGGMRFEVACEPHDLERPRTVFSVRTPLVGDFNVSNILAAAGAALALGLAIDAIQAGVRSLPGVPGRMERVDRGQPFTAIVDFAHTPNALDRALRTGRGLVGPGGRVLAVFGCAGLRDREKRRLMGQVAAQQADYTVITAEDPRTEDLDAVIAETAAALVEAGKEEGRDFVRVPDRQRAIVHAVAQARPGDVVILCGKGHEQSMCFGTEEHPWQDQAAMAWALDRLKGQPGPPPFVLPTWQAGEP